MNAGKYFIVFIVLLTCGNCCEAQITISVFAGNGSYGYSGDGGSATSASFKATQGVCANRSGDVYVVDQGNCCIRRIESTGIISTFGGTGICGYSGDGGEAVSGKLMPYGLSCDVEGNLLIGDYGNNRVRKIDVSTGIITTIAGCGINGYDGDGGPATNAKLSLPIYACSDITGNVYISEYGGGRIRKVDENGIISTIADSIGGPVQLAIGVAGNLFVVAKEGHVYKIDATGILSIVAGGGSDLGSGIPATSALLSGPEGIAVDCNENLVIADNDNDVIKLVDVETGILTIIAGGGTGTITTAGIPGLSAMFHNQLICFDPYGNLYSTDDHIGYIYKLTGISTCGPFGNPCSSQQPEASFSFQPESKIRDTLVSFHNTSIEATSYIWDFGDSTQSFDINPVHEFKETGTYNICLTALNGATCKSKICKAIFVEINTCVGVPSAFTPNNDGENDILYVRGRGLKKVSFKVFNRYGQLVFETNDVRKGWDGTCKENPQPIDVYAYALGVEYVNGETQIQKGNITLLR